MTSKAEQFYIQHIAKLEKQLKQRDDRIATLEKQVAELTDKVAKLRILQIVFAHTAKLISDLSQRLALNRQIISLSRRFGLLL